MIGIRQIGTYIPVLRVDNVARHEQFGVSPDFVRARTGFCRVAIKAPEETVTSMAEKAVRDLLTRAGVSSGDIEALVVVTQNPDRNIPHVAAELHGLLGLEEGCAAFDVSLGCSGYVYGLSILSSFMRCNGLRVGVLVTADPYSKIVDQSDKNTALIFGDAATATLLSDRPLYTLGNFSFGTEGREANNLACDDGRLYMNGRAVFNFAATHVPADVQSVIAANNLTLDGVDSFIFHQGSRYIVETLASRLQIPAHKVIFSSEDYGNTISSSIPLLLSKEITKSTNRNILISGFGVGFSWSSVVLKRLEKANESYA